MNREQRRKATKGMSKERMEVTGIVIHFKNGQYVNLDTTKVQIIDRVTNKPLFDEVLEPIPAQISSPQSDEPFPPQPATGDVDPPSTVTDMGDGNELVQNGNWSGVRPKKRNKEES